MESKYIDLVINRLTQAKYDELKANNQISEEEIYNIIDHDDLFYYKTQLYTKEEIDALLNGVSERISSLESTVNQTINTEISNINTEISQFKTNVQSTYATKIELEDNVNANPGLSGNEDILESIKIDGVNYQVFPEGSIEFNTEKSTDPDAYTLGSIIVGTDVWNMPEGGSGTGGGSSVIANPELSGGEEALESITIDEVNYTLKGEEMVFSDNPVDGANILRNVQLGEDNWGIPYIDENRITTVENWITDETSGAAAMANQITSLSAEVQLKANTSDVYNKTEVDNLLSNYTPGTGGGSNVVANPELNGTETDLESITIDGTNYSVLGNEIVFSSIEQSGESLKSITIGDTIWSIPSSVGDGSSYIFIEGSTVLVESRVSEPVSLTFTIPNYSEFPDFSKIEVHTFHNKYNPNSYSNTIINKTYTLYKYPTDVYSEENGDDSCKLSTEGTITFKIYGATLANIEAGSGILAVYVLSK